MENRYRGLGYMDPSTHGQAVNSYAEPQPLQPALSTVSTTLEEATQLAFRVQSLVERLCGSVPVDGAAKGLSQEDNCIFGAIRSQAENTRRQISDAFYALDRLGRELP